MSCLFSAVPMIILLSLVPHVGSPVSPAHSLVSWASTPFASLTTTLSLSLLLNSSKLILGSHPN
jgi:hypothetical protein